MIFEKGETTKHNVYQMVVGTPVGIRNPMIQGVEHLDCPKPYSNKFFVIGEDPLFDRQSSGLVSERKYKSILTKKWLAIFRSPPYLCRFD